MKDFLDMVHSLRGSSDFQEAVFRLMEIENRKTYQDLKIEHLKSISVENRENLKRFLNRACPKCGASKMEKVFFKYPLYGGREEVQCKAWECGYQEVFCGV